MMMRSAWSLVLVFVLALTLFAQSDTSPVPAHHKGPPPKGSNLPRILPREQLWGPSFQHEYQIRAYELASRIPDLVYQLPCYCYCDRIGHGSLRTCYETTHAAHCSACLKELYFAYDLHKKGRNASQIRQAIIKGGWEKIDLQAAARTK